MATDSEQLYDAIATHQTYIERVGAGQGNKANATIDGSEEELIAAIAAALLAIDNAPTQANFRRLEILQRKIEKIRGDAFQQAEQDNLLDMITLSDNEGKWINKVLFGIAGITAGLLTARDIERITTIIPFAGRTPGQWWDSAFVADIQRIMTSIRSGVQSGLSINEIVNSIRGTRTVAGVLESTRNNVKVVGRTITTGVSNSSQDISIKKSREFSWVIWVSILDAVTSAICRGLSGEKWRIDEPHPSPPAHGGCRSSLSYVFKGDPIPQEPSYDEWIRRQPRSVQEDILPKWQLKELDNGVKLKAFVSKDIEPLTMKEYMKKFG